MPLKTQINIIKHYYSFPSRRAATRLLVDRLSPNLHCWRPGIVHGLACHPAPKRWKRDHSINNSLMIKEGKKQTKRVGTSDEWYDTVPILDFSSHGHESLFHIGGIFCTCFHKGDPNFICKCLTKTERVQVLCSNFFFKNIMQQFLEQNSPLSDKMESLHVQYLGCLIRHNFICCEVTLVAD